MNGNLLEYEKLAIPNSDKLTEFQKKVYGATRLIPKGAVSTYGSIAKLINCKSSQAVGQALKRNPWPIDLKNVDSKLMVPCHRVIGHNGFIGGFSGQRHGIEIKRKIKLLKKEGIQFVLNKNNKKYSLEQKYKHKIIKQFIISKIQTNRKIVQKVGKKRL
eukprot:542441_1